jgi:hypothetical protein
MPATSPPDPPGAPPAGQSAGSPPREGWGARAAREPEVLALAALSLLVSGAYVAAELYFLDGRLGFSLDDSWIHLAFGRALAAGEGLSIDPGRPVAGSTAPLWTACYALVVLLPGSAILWAKTAGAMSWALRTRVRNSQLYTSCRA